VIGSPDSDTITGSALANTLSGGAGTDELADGSSLTTNADTFNGGADSDIVSYAVKGAGEAVTVNLNTTTGGEAGESDTIAADVEGVTGGAGDDVLTGDENANVLTGGAGADTARFDGIAQSVTATLGGTGSGQGGDRLDQIENLVGSTQADTLNGDSSVNSILGGDGDDTLQGGDGNDVLNGEGQSDTVAYGYATLGIEADLGADSVVVGVNDTDSVPNVENAIGSAQSDIFFDGPAENNIYDGAGGSDFADYQAATAAMTVDLATGSATGAGIDQLSGVENAIGGPQGDTIMGDGGANDLRGMAGADTITGALGADDVFGGDGGDQLKVRDGVGDDVDCGAADAAADAVEADAPSGTDTVANCGVEDVIDLGVPPVVTPPVVTPPAATPPVVKKCKKPKKKTKKAVKKYKKCKKRLRVSGAAASREGRG
jgi:Ca2+-binding RTX toxin-like protein